VVAYARPVRVDVLALDDVFDLGLSAVLDAFRTANELIELSGIPARRFDVRIIGVRKHVTTSLGFRVPVHPPTAGVPDCVVVPAIGFKMPKPLETALGRLDVRDAAALLQRAARRGALMTAACIGTFVMAESGVLNGQRATTTWWLAPLFRKRYPQVLLEDSNMVVRSGRVVTAWAALGHMDLGLWIIRSVSPRLDTYGSLSDCRFPSVTVRIRADGSPAAHRPAGSGASNTGLARICGTGFHSTPRRRLPLQEADARPPNAQRPWEDAACLRTGPAPRAGGAPHEHRPFECRRSRGTGRLRRWGDTADAAPASLARRRSGD
jgi:hypothetical protein